MSAHELCVCKKEWERYLESSVNLQAGIVVHSVFLRALYIAKLSEGKGIGKWGILGKHLASRS